MAKETLGAPPIIGQSGDDGKAAKSAASTPPPPPVPLPDAAPAPSADKKRKPKGMSRREALVIGMAALLLAALAAWFICFVLGAARTPQQAINAHSGNGGLFDVQQEIIQVSLPGAGERSIYFYVSGDALACALLQRKASGYKVLQLSGHLPLKSPGKDGIWMAASLTGAQKEFLVYGMLYDPALTTVEVNGVPAVVVSNGTYRCWYFYGEGNMSINSESVVYK